MLRTTSASPRVPSIAACLRSAPGIPNPSPLDDLRLGEDLDDAIDGRAVVLDDRARLASLGVGDAFDRLSGFAPLDSEVTQSDLFDLLGASGHDAFQRGVPRLGDAGGDRDQRGSRRLHAPV